MRSQNRTARGRFGAACRSWLGRSRGRQALHAEDDALGRPGPARDLAARRSRLPSAAAFTAVRRSGIPDRVAIPGTPDAARQGEGRCGGRRRARADGGGVLPGADRRRAADLDVGRSAEWPPAGADRGGQAPHCGRPIRVGPGPGLRRGGRLRQLEPLHHTRPARRDAAQAPQQRDPYLPGARLRRDQPRDDP